MTIRRPENIGISPARRVRGQLADRLGQRLDLRFACLDRQADREPIRSGLSLGIEPAPAQIQRVGVMLASGHNPLRDCASCAAVFRDVAQTIRGPVEPGSGSNGRPRRVQAAAVRHVGTVRLLVGWSASYGRRPGAPPRWPPTDAGTGRGCSPNGFIRFREEKIWPRRLPTGARLTDECYFLVSCPGQGSASPVSS
jgi:hypothetical protein